MVLLGRSLCRKEQKYSRQNRLRFLAARWDCPGRPLSTHPRTGSGSSGSRYFPLTKLGRAIDALFDTVQAPPGVGEGAMRRENWYRWSQSIPIRSCCRGAPPARRPGERSHVTVLPSGSPDTVGASDFGYFGAHNFGIPSLHVPLSNASSAGLPTALTWLGVRMVRYSFPV